MISFKKNKSSNLYRSPPFNIPNNFEHSKIKRKLNVASFNKLNSKIIEKSRQSTSTKLQLMGRSTEGDKIYDDDIVQNISKEFDDRITSLFVIGDVIRSFRKPIKRKEITVDEFVKSCYRSYNFKDIMFLEKISYI